MNLQELWNSEEECRREPRPDKRPIYSLVTIETGFIPSMTPSLQVQMESVHRAGATQRPPLYDGCS